MAGTRAGKFFFECTSSESRKSKNPTQDFPADGLVRPVQLFPLLKEKTMKTLKVVLLMAVMALGVAGTATARQAGCCPSADCCASCNGC
jgi:hypothetical protein